MDIVLGATGRVGSGVVRELLAKGRRVRAVVRNPDKARRLREAGAEVAAASYNDLDAMRTAFAGGATLFVVTPEDPASPNWLLDAEVILRNCQIAALSAGIGRVVGLSSNGAQHAEGTGALLVSHRLEEAFACYGGESCIVRPSYYYSNWFASLDAVRQGVLPTFLPADLEVPMIAPSDVAAFAAKAIAGEVPGGRVYEISGPQSLTPADVARLFGKVLGRRVTARQVPENEWKQTVLGFGFSLPNADLFVEMTRAVVSGLTAAEGEVVTLPTGFEDYARRELAMA